MISITYSFVLSLIYQCYCHTYVAFHIVTARKLIEGGVAVAIATDFNPNAHCTSMPLTMHMACVLQHLTMPEALVASTLNAAGLHYKVLSPRCCLKVET